MVEVRGGGRKGQKEREEERKGGREEDRGGIVEYYRWRGDRTAHSCCRLTPGRGFLTMVGLATPL